MAAEVLSSARWQYCGEPDESQRAVLGKDCGAGAEFHVAPSASVWVPLTVLPPLSGPFPSRAETASSLLHYLGLGQGSSVIPPSFFHHFGWMRIPLAPSSPKLYLSPLPTHLPRFLLSPGQRFPCLSRAGSGLLSRIPLVIPFGPSPSPALRSLPHLFPPGPGPPSLPF